MSKKECNICPYYIYATNKIYFIETSNPMLEILKNESAKKPITSRMLELYHFIL